MDPAVGSSRKLMQRRRVLLPDPDLPEDDDHLALVDLEVDPCQDLDVTEALVQPFDRHDRVLPRGLSSRLALDRARSRLLDG